MSLIENGPATTFPERRRLANLSVYDCFHALGMVIACVISYSIITRILSPFVSTRDQMLGQIWASVATIFVFRETHHESVSAGISRLISTCLSFSLCLAYLVILPFHPLGLALLLGLGTLLTIYLGRRDDMVAIGITTTVVMIGAAANPHEAWHQPFLRLFDTAVGVTVGVGCKLISSYLYQQYASRARFKTRLAE